MLGGCVVECGSMMDLGKIREEIDCIDAAIVELLKQRMECVHRVGEAKNATGAPLFVPERESVQREKLAKLNAGVLPEQALLSIYRQIISCGYLLEGGLRVGYLGPEGTWSHQAALARFGDSVTLVPFPSFQHLFDAVKRGEVNYSVVPIENSSDGSVSQAMDLMGSTDLRICAQTHLSVQNCLLSVIPREKIRVLYSHPQVLGQCKQWLQQNFPNAEQIPTASTAAAARIAKKEAQQGAAALGSRLVAELNGMAVLEANIQDKVSNTTRFAIIGKQLTQPTGHDRTTLCFGVPHTPGSLVDVLSLFKKHGINIHCIYSRPTRNVAWEYLFYIDVEGHEDEAPLKKCLAEVRACTPMLKVLGSYPEQ